MSTCLHWQNEYRSIDLDPILLHLNVFFRAYCFIICSASHSNFVHENPRSVSCIYCKRLVYQHFRQKGFMTYTRVFHRYEAVSYCQNENVNGLLMTLKTNQERRNLIQHHSGIQTIVGSLNSMWIGVRRYIWEWINGK